MVQCAPWASNGPNLLGLCALQAVPNSILNAAEFVVQDTCDDCRQACIDELGGVENDGIEADEESDGGGDPSNDWPVVVSKGSFGDVDIGEDAFNDMFRNSETHIGAGAHNMDYTPKRWP